jgi:hypothetical protein
MVASLIDEAAIKRIQLQYCRGIDRQDWELVRQCFHPGTSHHVGPYDGPLDGFILWLPEVLSGFECTTHFSGNQLVQVDGDVARAEQYVRAYHRPPVTDDVIAREWIVNLRYLDRFERREGSWRIARRVLVTDSAREDTLTAVADLGPEWLRGSRFPSDLSYVAATQL